VQWGGAELINEEEEKITNHNQRQNDNITVLGFFGGDVTYLEVPWH